MLVEIRGDTARQALLSGSNPSSLDALCEEVPAWAALRQFARRWEDRQDERRDLVRNVWVEFDLIAASRATPPVDALTRPSVFWGPREIGRGDYARFTAFTEYVRESYTPFPDRLPLDRLEQAIVSLPDDARVFQLGAMQLRGDVMLRMCINRMPLPVMADWLESQQWRGDARRLRESLDALAPTLRVAALDVDFTAAGIGPKIGIECYREWAKPDPAQWLPLLDHVAKLGLCESEKREAVLAFPAKTEYPLAHQYRNQEDGLMFPVIYRNIHHVKLSYSGDAFGEAKAYLGITRPGVKVGYPFGKLPDGEADEWLSQ